MTYVNEMERTRYPEINDPSISILVRDVHKTFEQDRGLLEFLRHPLRTGPTISALKGVSFHVSRGQVFGILGPNGAGKTTLLKILANLILPTTGDICIENYSLSKDPDRVRASIGFIPSDERSFFWRLSGLENLYFFAALFEIPRRTMRERIDFYLDFFELSSCANKRFFEYSSGQKKAFSIVRGLLADPPVLLLDEPTNNLDPLLGYKFKKYVAEILTRRKGKTVLWATHRLEEVSDLCERVALLDRGIIVYECETEQFKRLCGAESQRGEMKSFEETFRRLILRQRKQ